MRVRQMSETTRCPNHHATNVRCEHCREVRLTSASNEDAAQSTGGADDRTQGWYRKFHVERTDGRSAPGQKHDGCDYFVLDLTHDPYSVPALKRYAQACRSMFPSLATDIEARVGSEGVAPEAGGESGAQRLETEVEKL